MTGSRGALRTQICRADAFDGATIKDYGDFATDEAAAVRIGIRRGTTYFIEIGDSTEPEFEQQHDDFNLDEDLRDVPDGGLLVVHAQFTKGSGATRHRSVRH